MYKIKKINFKIMILVFLVSFINILFNNTFAIDDENVKCKKAIVMDIDSGSILYSKNGFDKVFPASTTKVLTAIIAIENLDLEKTVVASENAILSTPDGSSVMYIKIGEILTVKQLLYGLMLPSGNDAANVLAEEVSGNVEKFVEIMNEKAKKIGCTSTHFTNPHGFHDENHYSTAYDMAKILRYALKNETFREIIETKSIDIPQTNKTTTARGLINTNKMVNKKYKDTYYYEYAIAGKTGFTDEARGTLVTYGKKDNKNIIITVFDGTQLLGNEVRYFDAKLLFEYAFNNFDIKDIINSSSVNFDVYDKKSGYNYRLKLKDDISSLIKNKDYMISYDNLEIDFNLLNKISNNLAIYTDLENYNVGSINIKVNGDSIYLDSKCPLILTEIKKENNIINKICKFLEKDIDFYIIFISILTGSILILIIIKIILKNNIKNENNIVFSKSSRIKLKKHKDKF